ncbi:MAG: type I-E CRISPR-associated protein Cas5/CasD [Eubacteriales bacterium]|nr:type I-E CRISPR-associated protein Cas5/CasD [Clostridiales bacterium]MDY5835503.1 type I-E CRISPR-associated protein Cas5/CasD [Eubacteriales bacterium]
MKTLLCKCAGPLQSWGNDSNYDTRRTAYLPTKSAFVGILAAALGYRRDEDEKIQALNDLDFAVRIDQPGNILMDFHMAHSKTNVYITKRYYLQDAVFVVALGSDYDNVISGLEEALSRPYFQLFMGRRSVPVTADFILGTSDLSPIVALETLPWQAANWYQRKARADQVTLEIYADADLVDSKFRRMEKERVISFSQQERKFSYRPIGRTFVNTANKHSSPEDHDSPEDHELSGDHDAFAAIGG